ncbi:reverse transcriptase domain-containing protein, partial [Tanacetum coccineum]
MRTRNPNNSPVTILRHRNRRRAPNVVEPELRTIVEVAPMAERTMEELLQATTEGYREAIVIPEINADHFEIKTNLLQLVQANPFHGFERENPHTHINNFNRITSTLKFRDVPNDVIKLMMFLYSLEGAARVWDPRFLLILLPKRYWNEKPRRQRIRSKLGCTSHIQPLVNPIPIPEPDVPKTLPKPNIPYPSKLNDQKFSEKALNQMEKIFQIFQDLRFDISFADALLLMPRFSPTIKNLLMNKEKLFELTKLPLNEKCSAMLLKKLPEKLRDPGKFLIPCDFPRMDVCHALADLGTSVNLMPFSIWKNLSLPELTPTRMTLELADRSITRPKGFVEDVFVKVGSFHFPTDFVVVDFEAAPRVPLILGRSFLRTGRALIDVYEGELILRNGDERLIFHVDKHPQKHANESSKMINFIDVSCEDNFGEVLRLKKSNHFSSGSTTPLSDSRPSLVSFETSDSLLEEFANELALLDPFPPRNEDVDVEAELRE